MTTKPWRVKGEEKENTEKMWKRFDSLKDVNQNRDRRGNSEGKTIIRQTGGVHFHKSVSDTTVQLTWTRFTCQVFHHVSHEPAVTGLKPRPLLL